MYSFDNDTDKQAVFETLKTMNRLWSSDRRPEALADYFHERMTAVCGGESTIRTNGQACIEGWTRFSREAENIYIEESKPHIELFLGGTVAVAAYYFDCSYTMKGRHVAMKGRDLFTLIKEHGRWHIIADHFSPLDG